MLVDSFRKQAGTKKLSDGQIFDYQYNFLQIFCELHFRWREVNHFTSNLQ